MLVGASGALLGPLALVPTVEGLVATLVKVFFVLVVAVFAYKVMQNVKRPKDILFEDGEEDEDLRSGRDDEEWDYY